jgi:hypothetical protein
LLVPPFAPQEVISMLLMISRLMASHKFLVFIFFLLK